MIRRMIRPKFYPALLALAVFAPWWTFHATAACTGSRPTWTSTPDRTSVSNCVNNAGNGDTIHVTAGSATWSPNIAITNKNLTIIGPGAANITITGTFDLAGSASRISGFTFVNPMMSITGGSQGFRVDHSTFTIANAASAATCVLSYGNASTPNEGLFDHISFNNCQAVMLGVPYDVPDDANSRWSEPLNLATQHSIVFEDSDFLNANPPTNSYLNCFDSNLGGRYVVRFSTLRGCRFEIHSLQGDRSRGTRTWEIYNNTLTNPGPMNYRPYLIRSGTGLIFHNTSDGHFIHNGIDIDNGRSSEPSLIPSFPVFKMCDGTSFVDGNTAGQQGYPCRDQIGRSTDASRWTNYGNPPPSQALAPAYIWRNTELGNETPVVLNCEGDDIWCTRQRTFHIIESRDYYTYRASFNGTTGIGEGTLANRPATCTTGVAYWATDQGNWNHSGSGAQGVLYRCTSTNTWSLYYTPYTYPHPLQGGGGGGRPDPPTNLRVVVH